MTVAEVAARLRVYRTTVYRLFDQGLLEGIKVGSERRISVAGYNAYLQRASNKKAMAQPEAETPVVRPRRKSRPNTSPGVGFRFL